MANLIEAYQGADRYVEAQLEAGDYSDDVGLRAECWPGDDQAVLFEPECTWIDPIDGRVLIAIYSDHTATLPPATYPIRLGITDQSGLSTAWVPLLQLRLLPSPGAGTARKVYGTADDLRRAVPYVDQLQGGFDQAGFREQRADAREWLEGLAHRHWGGRQSLGSLETSRTGQRDPWLQEQFDADRLLVTREVSRCVSLYAAGLILAPQIGTNAPDGTSYSALAARLFAQAEGLVKGLVLEVDINGDGRSEIAIDLGTIETIYC